MRDWNGGHIFRSGTHVAIKAIPKQQAGGEVRSQNFQSLTFQGCGEIISGIATIQAKEDTLKYMKTP